jgi:two-component system sensor histidine kinase KdpD
MDVVLSTPGMSAPRALRRSALLLLRGAILIGAVTAVCYRAGLNSASAALLYLIAVVLQSLDCGFPEAAAVSVFAVANLDYFFMEPQFSLALARQSDAVTLSCLLIVSLVITRIQSKSRAEASESKLQRANMERLYKISQRLLAVPPESATGPALLDTLLSASDITAVCLFEADTLECHQAGTSAGDLEAKTREGYISGRDAVYPELGIAVRCLRAGGTVTGAVGFEGLRDGELAAPALAALAAAALERVRSFRSATAAAAQAHAEMLRSTILDALAHEIKTPLATILAAAGGLRAAGLGGPEQAELTEMIEDEASRLGDLTSRLLRLARLDREEVQPRLEPADAAELAGEEARRYSKIWLDRRISFRKQGEVGEVLADPELIQLAVSQMVENACRYSKPDADVSIELMALDKMAAITVWNEGAPIAESERARIFDRFYRGTAARRMAPGTGLGLYVARKIALAHGGDLALVDGGRDFVGFRLTIPLWTQEACPEHGKA